MNIEYLDPRNEKDVDDVVALHARQFPQKAGADIRKDLLRHHFYGNRVKDGLVQCAFARKDGQVVGLIAYTKYPATGRAAGYRKHRFHLAWILLRGLLTRPNFFQSARWLMASRRGRGQGPRPAFPPGTGEILFIAVDPSAQTWVPAGGASRLTVRLFETAEHYFRRERMRRIFLLVRASNTASNLFCHSLGCRLVKVESNGAAWHHFYYNLETGAPS